MFVAQGIPGGKVSDRLEVTGGVAHRESVDPLVRARTPQGWSLVDPADIGASPGVIRAKQDLVVHPAGFGEAVRGRHVDTVAPHRYAVWPFELLKKVRQHQGQVPHARGE